MASKKTGLEGISDDGNAMIQTKQGGGYMLLSRRESEGSWVRIAEVIGTYVDGCYLLDQYDAQ